MVIVNIKPEFSIQNSVDLTLFQTFAENITETEYSGLKKVQFQLGFF